MGEQAAKSGFINKIFHSLAVVMACPGMTFPSQFSLMVALTPSEGCIHTLFQPGSFSVPEVKTFLRWQMAWKVCFKRCLITVCIYSPHCKCWSPGKQVSTGRVLGEGEEAPAQTGEGAEPWGAPSLAFWRLVNIL